MQTGIYLLRNAAIFGAILSTAACIEVLAKKCIAEGIEKGISASPTLLGISVAMTVCFASAPLSDAAFTKMKNSSPAQLIGNQLNKRVVAPLGTALNCMLSNIQR